MPFKHPCFISYRHLNHREPYIEWIVEALKRELKQWIQPDVFRDVDYIDGGVLYNDLLPLALCHSACMVVLYSPRYFHRDYTYCAREFLAMQRLEQHRWEFLRDQEERSNGLVIFIAIRGHNFIPSEIIGKRQIYNFEPYTLMRDMRKNPKFKADVKDIGEYIFNRWKVFESLARQHDLCGNCHGFKLPSEDDIQPLLDQVTPRKAQFVWGSTDERP